MANRILFVASLACASQGKPVSIRRSRHDPEWSSSLTAEEQLGSEITSLKPIASLLAVLNAASVWQAYARLGELVPRSRLVAKASVSAPEVASSWLVDHDAVPALTASRSSQRCSGLLCQDQGTVEDEEIDGEESVQTKIPTNPQEVANALLPAMQAAIQSGLTRLVVKLPVGMRFGVFGDVQSKDKTVGDPEGVSVAVQQRAEFELAYVIAAMLEGECTVVLESGQAATVAKDMIYEQGIYPRILGSFKKLKDKGKPSKGFGAKKSETEGDFDSFVLVVRPTEGGIKKAMTEVDPVNQVLVLLNPPTVPPGFAPVFMMEDNPHPEWEGGMLFHAIGSDWALAAGNFQGVLSVHGRTSIRPTLEEIDTAFTIVKDDENPLSMSTGARAALKRKNEDEIKAKEKDAKKAIMDDMEKTVANTPQLVAETVKEVWGPIIGGVKGIFSGDKDEDKEDKPK